MKKCFLLLAFICMLISCEEKSTVDIHRMKKLLQYTSQLNEKDNGDLIDGFEMMIDKYANMSIAQRDDFLRKEEGKEFFEVYFSTALYLGALLEADINLTKKQREKAILLLEKYEENPARFTDIKDSPEFENLSENFEESDSIEYILP